jgi:hypothetical protein
MDAQSLRLFREVQVAYNQVVSKGLFPSVTYTGEPDLVLTLQKNALAEVTSALNKVMAYAEANNLRSLSRWCHELDSIIILSGQVEGINMELVRMLSSLIEDELSANHYDFVSQFGIIVCSWPNYKTNDAGHPVDDNGRLHECTFAPSFYRLRA